MPKIQRTATILMTSDELSKALGISFETITGCEWWEEGYQRKGLKLTIRVEEEINFKALKPGK